MVVALDPFVHSGGLDGQSNKVCSQEPRPQLFVHQKPGISFFLFSQQEFTSWITNTIETDITHNAGAESRFAIALYSAQGIQVYRQM